jgi:ABC-type sugar transport system ATPase subunit
MGFGLKMTGHPKDRIASKVKEASRILKLDDYLTRKPKALSGGQRQRVAIGRAIVRGPEVFLFDEPLSNLDAELRVEMRVEIARLHREIGATMIYVTHDQVEAMTLADKIVVLRAGRVEQVGRPLDLYHDPDNRFVAGFIGSPAMNFFDARLVVDAGQLIIDGGSFRVVMPEAFRANLLAHAGKEVVFGVRPEDIALHLADADVGSTISARAEVVELLGSEIFAHLNCDAHALVARMAVPKQAISVGETIRIDFKMANTHVFDKTTSDAIV